MDGAFVDAMGNGEITQYGGEYGERIASFGDVICRVPGYNVEKNLTDDHHYLDVAFDEITTGDEMGEWILDGITFECLIYVEEIPSKTVGFMCNLNEGGIGLASKAENRNLNFQIGTMKNSTADYPIHSGYFAGPYANGGTGDPNERLNADGLTHVVATCDPETNMISLYKDGVLLGTGDYGTGPYRHGKAMAGHIPWVVTAPLPASAWISILPIPLWIPTFMLRH